MDQSGLYQRAAEAISAADALLIGAGAGMGVDSGLPDFRGTQGFWRAYPLYQKLNLDFAAMANPAWFRQDPEFAWGFYGHRLNLYRETAPHQGFILLRRFAERMRHGAFVFTSNVDGHFQKAGFPPDRVLEVHGSIHHMQCLRGCGCGILPADGFTVSIDPETLRAGRPLPACPSCGGLLRPNILMFGDGGWDDLRTDEQRGRFQEWLEGTSQGKLVVVECGAGTAIPTVRLLCERMARSLNATLVRLNVREPQVPAGHVGLSVGALEGLRRIGEILGGGAGMLG